MTLVIEGGPEAHRRLLEEIFVGLGPTEIKRVRFGSHVVRAVPGDLPTPEAARRASGLSIELVDPPEDTLRVDWEMHLIGAALRERASRDGLEQVVWVKLASNAGTLEHTSSPDGPMSPPEVERLRTEVASAAAAAGAVLERLDLVCPLGHAWAARLQVEEPHAFLRLRFEDFTRAVQPWQERCGRQTYIEVVDESGQPVVIRAAFGGGGASSVPNDLACCDPSVYLGRPLYASPPPRCPVFD